MKPLEQSIVRTLAYFDVADYPLTREELFRFLWQPPAMGYGEFCERLSFNNKHGYYFLPGREETVETRRQKIVYAEKKLERAVKAAKKIRSVPFLKAVFVCNTVGSEQADKDSDIDFLIVASPKRVWLVRLFSNFLLRMWGLRTYGKKSANRVCLSFYADGDHLNLSSLRIVREDIHFAYWIHQMIPIYDAENYYEKFIAANSWTKSYLPNLRVNYNLTYRFKVNGSSIGAIWKKLWETFWRGAYGNIMETQARAMQMQLMKQSVKDKAKVDNKGVVLAEGVIKIHENDARQAYMQAWMEKLVK